MSIEKKSSSSSSKRVEEESSSFLRDKKRKRTDSFSDDDLEETDLLVRIFLFRHTLKHTTRNRISSIDAIPISRSNIWKTKRYRVFLQRRRQFQSFWFQYFMHMLDIVPRWIVSWKLLFEQVPCPLFASPRLIGVS